MNTTRLLRHINAVRCLRLLKAGRRLSRAEIARELGLTRSTAGNAVRMLIEAGLVMEGETAAEGRTAAGRPGVTVALDPAGAYSIGIDIGTRILTVVLVDLALRVVARIRIPAGSDFRDADAVLARLAALPERIVAEAGVPDGRVAGVGVSVPGLVGRDGRVVNAPFLEWRDFALRDKLARALPGGWPVVVRNDAVAFATAECAVLDNAATETLLVLLLAEGIGSALVQDGAVLEGAHGHAGEVGHVVVTAGGVSAPFEQIAGALAFSDQFGAEVPVEEGAMYLLARLEAGDHSARAAAARWAMGLAAGLADVVHLLDPGRIALGGPLAMLYPAMAAEVERNLAAALLFGMNPPPITVTRFGADGAAIGAAAMLRETIFALPDIAGASSPMTAGPNRPAL